MNWQAFDWSILGPALLAGLLVLATHVPLGMSVLDRGIVFIDLAIAQVAGLGVILADNLGVAEHGLGVQLAAVVAALLGAALLAWTERRAAQQHEAFIGVLFVLASCIGILALASNPHGGEHLKDMLVGQILWVSGTQLAVLAALSVVLCGWIAIGGMTRFGRFGFYGGFALAVTASVQLVGVYLVFSSLIIPALATPGFSGKRRYVVAGAVGAAGYALGLALSAWLDLPSGAVVVCTMAACGLAVRSVFGGSAAPVAAHEPLLPARNAPDAR
jgi:zinc/manganese transport system permease protein